MCFIQNKKFRCKYKAFKLGVPLYVKDKVEWDTKYTPLDTVGQIAIM